MRTGVRAGGGGFDEDAGELAVACEEVVGPFQVELGGGGEGVEGVAEGDGGEEGVVAGGAEVGDGDGGGEVEVAGGGLPDAGAAAAAGGLDAGEEGGTGDFGDGGAAEELGGGGVNGFELFEAEAHQPVP